jgi:hypothetical protein
MPSSTHNWTHFTRDDVTQPVTMLASLPPSDNDVVLLVEPEPEVTSGLLGRRKERSRGVNAVLWLANGYGQGDNWHAFLTFPEASPFERAGVVLPRGSAIVQSGKTDAEVRLPRELSPQAILDFALEACTHLAAEPVPGRWRAQIPDMSHRDW